MNKTGVIIGIVALLVVGGGAYALTQNSNKPGDSTANTQVTAGNSTTGSADEADPATTISYDDDGFSPATITVKAGTTVTVLNNSSQLLQFNSNPHPSHTDNDELNLDSLAPGKSLTFTPTKVGSFGFHNHLDESRTGTLVVQ